MSTNIKLRRYVKTAVTSISQSKGAYAGVRITTPTLLPSLKQIQVYNTIYLPSSCRAHCPDSHTEKYAADVGIFYLRCSLCFHVLNINTFFVEIFFPEQISDSLIFVVIISRVLPVERPAPPRHAPPCPSLLCFTSTYVNPSLSFSMFICF